MADSSRCESGGYSDHKKWGHRGSLAQNKTSLNPKGYRITGTTTSNNIEVLEGVETDRCHDHFGRGESADLQFGYSVNMQG